MRLRKTLLFTLIIMLATQVFAKSYYGPTVVNDRLYRIAIAIKPSEQVTISQTMVAIYKSNPHAFIDDNINNLYVGLLLAIPSLDEIARVDDFEASNIVKNHNSRWHAATKSNSKDLAKNENYTSHDLNNETHSLSSRIISSLSPESTSQNYTKYNGLENEDTVDSIESNNLVQNISYSNASSPTPTGIVTASAPHYSDKDIDDLKSQLSQLQQQLNSVIVLLQGVNNVPPLKKVSTIAPNSSLGDIIHHGFFTSVVQNNDIKNFETIAIILSILLSIVVITYNMSSSAVQSRRLKSSTTTSSESDDPGIDDEEYDYMGSSEGIPAKLNLARAYCDMGDHDKARIVLMEITSKGDSEQRKEAREMLINIDS